MGKFIRFISLVSLVLLSSCINLATVENSKNLNKNITNKIISDGKILQLFLRYSNNGDGNLDKYKSNRQNPFLEVSVAASIEKQFKFKSVHLTPTMYQKITQPENYKDDLVLKVVINENTVSDESGVETIIRAISFGFYSQKLLKNIAYKLEITDLHTNKVFKAESVINATYSYQAPMLVIPLNLDHHPFTASQQVAKHQQAIDELLKQVIE